MTTSGWEAKVRSRPALTKCTTAPTTMPQALGRALAWVGHVQTRNRGTVGGSLAHADPSAELPLVAQLLGAKMRLRSARGTRSVEADAFFGGPMTTTLAPDECLEVIEWPAWPERRLGCAFVETAARHGDFAMASAGEGSGLMNSTGCKRVLSKPEGSCPASKSILLSTPRSTYEHLHLL